MHRVTTTTTNVSSCAAGSGRISSGMSAESKRMRRRGATDVTPRWRADVITTVTGSLLLARTVVLLAVAEPVDLVGHVATSGVAGLVAAALHARPLLEDTVEARLRQTLPPVQRVRA